MLRRGIIVAYNLQDVYGWRAARAVFIKRLDSQGARRWFMAQVTPPTSARSGTNHKQQRLREKDDRWAVNTVFISSDFWSMGRPGLSLFI
jgi:hypothetical protein